MTDSQKRSSPQNQVVRLSFEDWQKEGTKRFGENQFNWKFVCPGCGNIASVEDFRIYKSEGATPNSAYQECIGRYTGGRSWANPKKTNPKKPCDYAGYGLICISPVEVVMPDGKIINAFAFAEAQS